MYSTDDAKSSVEARFSDSSSGTGTLLIKADGLHSRVRTTLPSHSPHVAANQDLPVRFLGGIAVYPADPADIVLKMRALDPFFFQGGDPQSDAYMRFSFVDTPSNNSRSKDPDTFECRVMIGWSYWQGFLGREEPFDLPPERSERLALMERIAEGWADPFRVCVMEIPADTAVQVVRLEDLVPRVGIWDTMHGRVAIVGDTAQAMTMSMNNFFPTEFSMGPSLSRVHGSKQFPYRPVSKHLVPGGGLYDPSNAYCQIGRAYSDPNVQPWWNHCPVYSDWALSGCVYSSGVLHSKIKSTVARPQLLNGEHKPVDSYADFKKEKET